jgi:hypothetical protein
VAAAPGARARPCSLAGIPNADASRVPIRAREARMARREKLDTEMLGVVAAVLGAFLSITGIALAIDGLLFDLTDRFATGCVLIVCGTLLYVLILTPHR